MNNTDSNTNYVPVEKIFEIREFYDVNYTEFCASIGPKIKLLFDLLAGYSYETAKELKQLDPNVIEFKGDAFSLLKIYDKIMNCKDLKVECDTNREDIIKSQNFITDPYLRTIMENGCSMIKDVSKIAIKFKKVG